MKQFKKGVIFRITLFETKKSTEISKNFFNQLKEREHFFIISAPRSKYADITIENKKDYESLVNVATKDRLDRHICIDNLIEKEVNV